MTFKEIRQLSGMSLSQFSRHFNIPYRTVQDWEYSRRHCPPYVLDLLNFKIDHERKDVVKMTEVEILMKDYCTESEAQAHLDKGTTIYEEQDFIAHFDSYMNEFCADDDVINAFRKMLSTKKPLPDWGVVKTDDTTYYICYVL